MILYGVRICQEKAWDMLKKNKQFFLVGEYQGGNGQHSAWRLKGVFNNKKLALKACKNPDYFFIHLELNKDYSSIGLERHFPLQGKFLK